MKQADAVSVEQVVAALDVAAGASIVLDRELKVVQASAAAVRLLRREVPAGSFAPALLCGDGPKRPVAEALAEGRTVRATIPMPGDENHLLDVRSLPTAQGWLLLLSHAGDASNDVAVFHGMWTRDRQMKHLFRLIERVADDDVTVLIRGESGTGKELVAHALHAASGRKGPLQAINCAALPPTLLEAELFGTVRGSFTGSTKDTPGLIRAAHKGTLFLDEVAELPLELQAKLLRVLETRQVLPVGASEPVAVDVRIISATHRSLRAEVEAGRFRADLMYRLRVIPLFLPALRERRTDIGLLAHQLLQDLNARSRRRRVEAISPTAIEVLEAWTWPGNVRELKNALHYALAMGDGPVLTASELPPELLDETSTRPKTSSTASTFSTSTARPTSLRDNATPQRGLIEQALSEAGGHRDVAAEALGVSRVTLWRWMKETGLQVKPRRR